MESTLDGIEPPAVGQTFDGLNRFAGATGSQRQTGMLSLAVHKDCAEAALAAVAADLGPSEPDSFTQIVD
jgi:hypothetical protein